MTDPLEQLQATVQEVVARLAGLEARIAEIERRSLAKTVGSLDVEANLAALSAPALLQSTIALAGRTLLVLAGAFLVRALTDGRVLPAAAGVGLGLAYAAFWQWSADAEALSARRESAAFHDLASSLIAFPLVWEATARFGVFSPITAYVALVAFFVLGLVVAWRRHLVTNAVLTTVLALGTAIALLSSTLHLLAAILALFAIAALVEWLAFQKTWLGLRWIAAIVLDGSVFLLVAVATRPELPARYPGFSIPAAAAAALALPALYIASIAARTLRLGQTVTAFEVVQGLVAVVLGFGGASRVLSAHQTAAGSPGALALLFGVLCYATAFAFVERRTGHDRNFYFYATAGICLTLGGSWLIGLGWILPFLWAGLGVVTAALGRRFDRVTLRTHGALYVAAAAFQADMLSTCMRALGGRATEMPALAVWTTGLAAVAGWGILASDPAVPPSGWARTPHLVLASLAVVLLGKTLQLGAWSALSGFLSRDAGAAAVVRTAVLAALALGIAWFAGRSSLSELRWLAYPVIAIGGLKLLTQDLSEGRPATLVASLALYGAVLLLAPRWMRPREKRPA